MLIGVICDTHDNLPMAAAAVGLLVGRGAEAVVHAGDFVAPFTLKVLMKPGIPLMGVFGNNDGERAGLAGLCAELFEPPHRFTLGGRTIVVGHDPDDLADVPREGVDLLIHGHTHRARVAGGEPLLLNPGEAGGWLTGRSTVALVELSVLRAEILEVGPQETVEI